MSACGICGLERHIGTCINALRAMVTRLQYDNGVLQERLRNHPPAPVVTPAVTSPSNGIRHPKRDRAAYMRDYRRRGHA